MLLNVEQPGGDLRLCERSIQLSFFLALYIHIPHAVRTLSYSFARALSLLSQGYFGKECFIKLAPFAVVIGVGVASGH